MTRGGTAVVVAVMAAALGACVHPSGPPQAISGRLTPEYVGAFVSPAIDAGGPLVFATSPGGRYQPEIAWRIMRQRIATRVVANHRVESMAAILFVMGGERTLEEGANACFHRPHCVPAGTCSLQEEETNNEEIRQLLRQRGLPAWFVTRAMELEGRAVWCPARPEWHAVGVDAR